MASAVRGCLRLACGYDWFGFVHGAVRVGCFIQHRSCGTRGGCPQKKLKNRISSAAACLSEEVVCWQAPLWIVCGHQLKHNQPDKLLCSVHRPSGQFCRCPDGIHGFRTVRSYRSTKLKSRFSTHSQEHVSSAALLKLVRERSRRKYEPCGRMQSQRMSPRSLHSQDFKAQISSGSGTKHRTQNIGERPITHLAMIRMFGAEHKSLFLRHGRMSRLDAQSNDWD